MTDLAGHSFFSYSHQNSLAARRLIAAQRELGIPTWLDVEDLPPGPMPERIRQELQDSMTASAVLWITEASLRSDWVRRIELPEALARVEREDGFFLLPVAAGISRRQAVEALRDGFGLRDPSTFRMEQIRRPVPAEKEARRIAGLVLGERLRAIAARLPAGESLTLRLQTWLAHGGDPGAALFLDWRHRFGWQGQARLADPKTWETALLPALAEVRKAVCSRMAGRSIVAGGNASLTAAAALGATFLGETGIHLAWRQPTPGAGEVLLSLDAEPSPVRVETRLVEGPPGASDLAVLVSVTQSARQGFEQNRPGLPTFRAVVEISALVGDKGLSITEPGQASALASAVREALLAAHGRFRPSRLHWFAAVPVGLAMLLGQRLNTLPPSQWYEHLEDGRYVPSALLKAGT